MGSLMAGWDSPVSESDPKSVIRERNRSLTKEEVEAYWKSQKQTEEEHAKHTFSPSDSDSCNPLSDSKQGFSDTNLEDIMKKNGWWRRSNWAFLNEPPVLDRPTNSYKPQFHVANLAASKLNKHSGISV